MTAPAKTKRRFLQGLPISVKLILATSIVVAAALAVATWYGTKTIDELAQAQVKHRREAGETAIARESDLIATSATGTSESCSPDRKNASSSAENSAMVRE